MRAEVAIALKDIRLLARDRTAAFFTFVFPIAVALFFGFVFGSGTTQPLEVAVFNGASSAKDSASGAFVSAMDADSAFELVMVDSREAGETLVRRGKAVGLVVLPPDFDAGAATIFSGETPSIDLITDPGRAAETGLLEGKLYQIAFQSMFASIADPKQFDDMIASFEQSAKDSSMSLVERTAIRSAMTTGQKWIKRFDADSQGNEAAKAAPSGDAAPSGGAAPSGDAAPPAEAAPAASSALADWTPVKINSSALRVKRAGPANSFAVSFVQGLAWALFGAVLSFSSSMADERERGTLLRLLAAPIRPIQVLIGKAGACFFTCVACESLLIGVGAMWFGVVVTSVPLFIVATLCTAFAFTGVMMALASIFRTQSGAQGAGRAVLLVLAMIGGGTIPLLFMPPIVQTAAGVSPFKWAVVAAEGATWRGWDFQEMLLSLSVLMAIGLAGGIASIVAMRKRIA